MSIVLRQGRPALLISNGTFDVPPTEWGDLGSHREGLEKAIAAVGVLRVKGDPLLEWVGTAFLVGPGLVMTARHCAREFIRGSGDSNLQFREGREASVSFDADGALSPGVTWKVDSPVFLHPYFDAALLQLGSIDSVPPESTDSPEHSSPNPSPQANRIVRAQSLGELLGSVPIESPPKPAPELPEPLTLAAGSPGQLDGRRVAVIGFSARDSRIPDTELMDRIFEGVFDVKRLQPGRLRDAIKAEGDSFPHDSLPSLTHDCSTLGGSAGAPLVELETGLVLGINYAGLFLRENRAVPAWDLARDARVRWHGVNFSDNPPWMSEWQEAAWQGRTSGEKATKPAAPFVPKSKKSQFFTAAQLRTIQGLLLQTDFTSPARLQTLFVGMNRELFALLPREGTPDVLLLNVLDVLNRTPRLIDGEMPLETLLANAVYGTKLFQESAELQRFLDMVREEGK